MVSGVLYAQFLDQHDYYEVSFAGTFLPFYRGGAMSMELKHSEHKDILILRSTDGINFTGGGQSISIHKACDAEDIYYCEWRDGQDVIFCRLDLE